MSLALTNAQIRFLRGQAHDLKAILQVGGKGLSDALVAEVGNALDQHELIKVKVPSDDREARDALIADLAVRTGSSLVQRIGHTAILFRPNPEKRRIVLPRG
jgi:RNA-binding protein